MINLEQSEAFLPFKHRLVAQHVFSFWTCEDGRGVGALILPNEVAHVTRGMAGGQQAPHIDGAKLQNGKDNKGDSLSQQVTIFK